MKQKLKPVTRERLVKKTGYWASVITLGLVVGISLQMVRANWTAPTATAPAGNVGAPINTGSQPQSKSSTITATGFASTGSISATGAVQGSQLCIGSDCRSAWPGGSSAINYVQGGLYGFCSKCSSSITTGSPCYTRTNTTIAPAVLSNGSCTCQSGFLSVMTGSVVNSYTTNTYFSCLKQ